MKMNIFYILLFLTNFGSIAAQEAVVINKTGFDIYNIYVSPSGQEEWSDDVIENDVLLSDLFKKIPLSSYGETTFFDFRFIDVDGDEYIKKNVDLNLHRKVVLSLDDLSYILNTVKRGSPNDWSINIRNNTGQRVIELYVSPHNSNSWGTNHIENEILENKTNFEALMGTDEELIEYDIRMDSSSGEVFIKEMILLSHNMTVVLTQADLE